MGGESKTMELDNEIYEAESIVRGLTDFTINPYDSNYLGATLLFCRDYMKINELFQSGHLQSVEELLEKLDLEQKISLQELSRLIDFIRSVKHQMQGHQKMVKTNTNEGK